MDSNINQLNLEYLNEFRDDRREFLQRVKKYEPKSQLSRIGGARHWQ
jgi:hypothetical protein